MVMSMDSSSSSSSCVMVLVEDEGDISKSLDEFDRISSEGEVFD